MARTVSADFHDKAALILDAAARVFAQQGYARATMAEIAAAAGFSKASAYHYFASKEAVLNALLQRSLHDLIDAVTAADLGPDAEPRARLAALIEAYVSAYLARVFVLTPLLLDRGRLRPAWREEVRRLERRLLDRFSEAAGTLGAPLPPHLTALLIFGAANWTYYWYDPAGDVSAAALARGVAALITGSKAAAAS